MMRSIYKLGVLIGIVLMFISVQCFAYSTAPLFACLFVGFLGFLLMRCSWIEFFHLEMRRRARRMARYAASPVRPTPQSPVYRAA